jgi:hypothetical protein
VRFPEEVKGLFVAVLLSQIGSPAQEGVGWILGGSGAAGTRTEESERDNQDQGLQPSDRHQ